MANQRTCTEEIRMYMTMFVACVPYCTPIMRTLSRNIVKVALITGWSEYDRHDVSRVCHEAVA